MFGLKKKEKKVKKTERELLATGKFYGIAPTCCKHWMDLKGGSMSQYWANGVFLFQCSKCGKVTMDIGIKKK